jgi:hypothetical protein
MLATHAALCGSTGSAETSRRQGLSGGNSGHPAMLAPPGGGGAAEVVVVLGGGLAEVELLADELVVGGVTAELVVLGAGVGEVDGRGRCLVGRCLPGGFPRDLLGLAVADADGLSFATELEPGGYR